ncbi:MAG: DUF3368 domain-containing protein [Thermoflexaceae bacterium]|nr:DUF3368 domain-containing protein [Thermoflexaceae bacterium]
MLYLHRIGVIGWLPGLFNDIWVPPAVCDEPQEGGSRGHDVPDIGRQAWLHVVNPRATPSEWLALDLGPGELAAMALAIENPAPVILLDDLLARRTARAAGLSAWGTLKVLLEARAQGITNEIAPLVARLDEAGLWLTDEVRRRILALAGEPESSWTTGLLAPLSPRRGAAPANRPLSCYPRVAATFPAVTMRLSAPM